MHQRSAEPARTPHARHAPIHAGMTDRPWHLARSRFRFRFHFPDMARRSTSRSMACGHAFDVMEPIAELWNRLGSSIERWASEKPWS